jgi:hypothetical protein
MDWSIIVLLVGYGWIIWEVMLSPTALTRSKRDVMAHMRRVNAKRGITMRPNWWYKMPDGTEHMSPTGREKDMIIRQGSVRWLNSNTLITPEGRLVAAANIEEIQKGK